MQENSLLVTGINIAQYGFSGFSYNPATFTATWTLTILVGRDNVFLDLLSSGPAAVTDPAGQPLDGDWTNCAAVTPRAMERRAATSLSHSVSGAGTGIRTESSTDWTLIWSRPIGCKPVLCQATRTEMASSTDWTFRPSPRIGWPSCQRGAVPLIRQPSRAAASTDFGTSASSTLAPAAGSLGSAPPAFSSAPAVERVAAFTGQPDVTKVASTIGQVVSQAAIAQNELLGSGSDRESRRVQRPLPQDRKPQAVLPTKQT